MRENESAKIQRVANLKESMSNHMKLARTRSETQDNIEAIRVIKGRQVAEMSRTNAIDSRERLNNERALHASRLRAERISKEAALVTNLQSKIEALNTEKRKAICRLQALRNSHHSGIQHFSDVDSLQRLLAESTSVLDLAESLNPHA